MTTLSHPAIDLAVGEFSKDGSPARVVAVADRSGETPAVIIHLVTGENLVAP